MDLEILDGWKSSGRPVGRISTNPGTSTPPWWCRVKAQKPNNTYFGRHSPRYLLILYTQQPFGSQKEPINTTDANKANKKISDLEKIIDKKARELKFYKQEVSGLQNQNEKLLNCGFESKETGKLDINDLVLENNRLKEYICSRRK